MVHGVLYINQKAFREYKLQPRLMYFTMSQPKINKAKLQYCFIKSQLSADD